MSTVDWSRWMELTPEERDELRRRYREIVRQESELARATNYAAMNAAIRSVASVFLLLLIQVDVLDGAVDQLAKRDQRVAGLQRGPAGEVGACGRKGFDWCGGNTGSALARADLADAAAIDTKICGDVVLAVSSRNHSLYDGDFLIVERHGVVPLAVVARESATIFGRLATGAA